jgi:hypothetical protein
VFCFDKSDVHLCFHFFFLGGNVSTQWNDIQSLDDETTADSVVTLHMGHVLQALVGCPRIPTNMRKGVGSIEFDHSKNWLSFANTCAPSICFSSTALLENYEQVEKHMLSIITETDGFGIA